MKWKDNLIYEFINQIISLKWILKPGTLWWLNRREKVFLFPCVKELYFHKVVLAKTVEHACAVSAPSASASAGPTVSWAVGEDCSPQLSSSSVLSNRGSARTCLLPGGPTNDIGWRRPPREHLLPSSHIQKEKPRMWIPDVNIRPFLHSIQTLTPWNSVTMLAWFLRSKESGVWFGGCLSLHPKTVVWRSATKSQVPTEPRKCHPLDAHVETTQPVL